MTPSDGIAAARGELRAAEDEHAAADGALRVARERLERLDRRIEQLDRVLNDEDEATILRRDEAAAAREQLLEERDGLTARRSAAAERLSAAGAAFLPFSDPRDSTGELADDHPVLLMPVRLETRFVTLEEQGTSRRQLWVRAYPDDCWVDTFDPTLTESEVRSARAYWAVRWQAAGVEAEERAAWRALVAGHGVGRATWIVEHHLPLNSGDAPLPKAAHDLVLVVATDEQLPADARAPMARYWAAFWHAGADRSAAEDALAALIADVGDDRARQIVASYRPVNAASPPPAGADRDGTTVRVATVLFPRRDAVATRSRSWSRPAVVTALPERLVLLGWNGGEQVLDEVGEPIPSSLQVGPDPSAGVGEQFQLDDRGELVVPEELRWMVDFDRAVECGMGFRVDLTDEQARTGFDRLFVLGLRLSSDAADGASALEDLLRHHLHSQGGLDLVPQGTPTNNTVGEGSGYSASDDAAADTTFARATGVQPASAPTGDDWAKRDGQRLAESLGIDPALALSLARGDATDMREARAMNAALWPATLGYVLDALLVVRQGREEAPVPVLSHGDEELLRRFFCTFVSGRGAVPALRIGAQPYGILATTAWSRLEWPRGGGGTVGTHGGAGSGFLIRLQELLERLRVNWSGLAGSVPHVGAAGDPHRTLLGILGLDAASVEYDQRYAETFDLEHNLLALLDARLLGRHSDAVRNAVRAGRALLLELGYEGDGVPDLLLKAFFGRSHDLLGPVIDDRPLSEQNRARAYTTDGRNYVQQLQDAARTSLEDVRTGAGYASGQAPTALLYLLLKFSLERGYERAARGVLEQAEVLSAADALRSRLEPPFIHVRHAGEPSESRWRLLYEPAPAVTANERPLHEFITESLDDLSAVSPLPEQLAALDLLDVPTARLERLFAEHVDCCAYRLDAWLLGLAHLRLEQLRAVGDEQPSRRGVYLGAYGWIEDLRPQERTLSPATIDPELEADFAGDERPPLVDSTNAGHVLAPSLDHAVTAAVLRNGYLSAADPELPDPLSVNLSSARVREALDVLDGLRSGQPLGALLGYRLERRLHDRADLQALNQVIYSLRAAFPLVANRITTTTAPAGTPAEAIEARNVVDGLRLTEQIRASGQRGYPFGVQLPALNAALRAAVDAEVDRMLDVHDALADLAVAESVHQVVQGNHDRGAATLDAFGRAGLPPIPDVVQTPRSGLGLTHRVGLHLDPATTAGAGARPRVRAEPALDAWLATVLPLPARVGCSVSWTDPTTGTTTRSVVTQADLRLAPLDLLYVLDLDTGQAMRQLDDLLVDHVARTAALRPDAHVSLHYTEALPGRVSFFELAALMRDLRALLLHARPLAPEDLALPDDAPDPAAGPGGTVALDRVRIADRLGELQPHADALAALVQAVDADEAAGTAADTVDDRLQELLGVSRSLAAFGLPLAGVGELLDARRRAYEAILDVARGVSGRWTERLADFDRLRGEEALLPASATEAERVALLLSAERMVSTRGTVGRPIADVRAALPGKRSAFASRRGDFASLLSGAETSVSALLGDLRQAHDGAPALIDLDATPVPVQQAETAVGVLPGDVARRARALAAELAARTAAVETHLAAADAAGDAMARVDAIRTAGRALFGEDFQMIPTLTLDGERAAEFANAWGSATSLTEHLRVDLARDDPVEDWLHGVARVRPVLHDWEEVLLTAPPLQRRAGRSAFAPRTLELRPLQLPYRSDAAWLALEFPPEALPDRRHLLYTAAYAADADLSGVHCGLLLDEWVEVVPARDVTAGLTFQMDRPTTEPPQAWLLVAPPRLSGTWSWLDLVAAMRETLDLARLRAVEPDLLDGTEWTRVLPATLFPALAYQISLTANLAVNNRVHEQLAET